MDYIDGKPIKYTCKNPKCNAENENLIHWKSSLLLSICKSCGKQNRIEFKNGQIVKFR